MIYHLCTRQHLYLCFNFESAIINLYLQENYIRSEEKQRGVEQGEGGEKSESMAIWCTQFIF